MENVAILIYNQLNSWLTAKLNSKRKTNVLKYVCEGFQT